MAAVQYESSGQRPEIRRWLLRHPESVASILVGVAWLWLVSIELRGASVGGHAGMPMMQGMPGMDMTPETAPLPGIANPIGWWVLMSVAMMGPAALAGVRHTGLNSLRWRRGRAMAEFAVAYLAVWAIFGAVALAFVAALPGAPGTIVLVIVLALAAAWQLTPLKRRWLRDCHRSVPLPPQGWKAELGSLRFGLRNGLSCLGSCWCLMLIMAVAPAYHLLWMFALTVVVTAEKLMERPRRATRMAATALAITAIVVVGMMLA
jgi:predicted metal-binding membrane protein